MPKISWEKGDIFSYGEGKFGIAISETLAVGAEKADKTKGWQVKKGIIPVDALPINSLQLPSEVKMVFKGVLAAIR